MKRNRRIKKVIYHVLVCLGAFVMVYPLLWLLSSSFKGTNTIFNTAGELIPRKIVLQNYVNGWHGFAKITFGTFFKNSAFISVTATVGTLISSAFVAYSFARCKFKGKKILFAAMLVSMMLPAQILMIPQYLWYQKLGWIGSNLTQIVTYCFATQGFFIYLMMNFINGVPTELDEAAKIDGCSTFGSYAKIILPLTRSGLAILTVLTFNNVWNDYMGPMIYLDSDKNRTIQLVLSTFKREFDTNYGAIMAGTVISLIPIVIVYVIAQKYIVEGIAYSGVKG